MECRSAIAAICQFASVWRPRLRLDVVKHDDPDDRVFEVALAVKAAEGVPLDVAHAVALVRPTVRRTTRSSGERCIRSFKPEGEACDNAGAVTGVTRGRWRSETRRST